MAPPQQYAQPGLAPPPKIANAWYASYFTSMAPHERMEAQAWFQAIDRDRSGHITANEIAGQALRGW
jgi:Ca2+-binding EF-hand superfamily protein